MIDPALVQLADGAHRTYARRTGEARGRVTVETSGAELVFDATTGRLVSPRGHRPPYRLVIGDRVVETSPTPEERVAERAEEADAPAPPPEDHRAHEEG